MRGHYLQHVPYENPGVLGEWFDEQNHVLSRTQLFRNPEFPSLDEIDFVLVLGGPMGANDEANYHWISKEKQFIERAMERSIPVMGICLGAQLIASVLGADVYPAKYNELGWLPIELTEEAQGHPFFRSWPDEIDVFHWHGDTFDLPEGAERLAESKGCENQAFVYEENVLGLQFHAEMRPDDIEYMLEFGSEHDMRGPYVQDNETILDGMGKADHANVLMKETLGKFLGNEKVQETIGT